jgi:hypothetical protein
MNRFAPPTPGAFTPVINTQLSADRDPIGMDTEYVLATEDFSMLAYKKFNIKSDLNSPPTQTTIAEYGALSADFAVTRALSGALEQVDIRPKCQSAIQNSLVDLPRFLVKSFYHIGNFDLNAENFMVTDLRRKTGNALFRLICRSYDLMSDDFGHNATAANRIGIDTHPIPSGYFSIKEDGQLWYTESTPCWSSIVLELAREAYVKNVSADVERLQHLCNFISQVAQLPDLKRFKMMMSQVDWTQIDVTRADLDAVVANAAGAQPPNLNIRRAMRFILGNAAWVYGNDTMIPSATVFKWLNHSVATLSFLRDTYDTFVHYERLPKYGNGRTSQLAAPTGPEDTLVAIRHITPPDAVAAMVLGYGSSLTRRFRVSMDRSVTDFRMEVISDSLR